VSNASSDIFLVVRAGGQSVTEPLGPASAFTSCLIGRCESAKIFLRYPTVSRHHCALWRRGEEIWVQDLGSAHGTWIDDQRIDAPRPLPPGTSFRVGDEVRIEVVWPGRSIRGGGDAGRDVALEPLGAVRAGRTARTVEFPLDRPRLTIGRDPDCEVPLPGQLMVSRRHATLESSGGRWFIRDAGSSNGTFVNSVRVGRPVELAKGDIISIGEMRLRFAETKLTSRLGGLGSQIDVQGVGIPGEKGKLVVEGVSFTIEPGELVGLLGPSGSGKTRLMHGICGRAPLAEGRVLYDGLDFASNFDALRTSIGYVPSWLTLHDSLTVAQGLRFASRLRLARDVSTREIESKVDEVLAQLKIEQCRDRLIQKLSDGQRRRVGLAVELLGTAPILYLDEVTTALDVPTHIRFMHQFRELADQGRSLLLISHHLNEFDLCDKWLYLIKGRVAYFGPPSEFLRYFGVRTLEEQLTRDEEAEEREASKGDHSREMAARFAKHRGASGAPASRSAGKPTEVVGGRRRSGLLAQARLLTERYVTLLVSDRANLMIMLGLAPVISVLMLLLNAALQSKHDAARKAFESTVSENVPDPAKAMEWMAAAQRQSSVLVFMLVMSAIIVGTFMSVREIVKERVRKQSMFLHERFAGMDPLAYFVSKLVPLGVLSALSSLAICLVIRLAVPRGAIDIDFGTLLAATVLVGWAAVLMGLLISCIASTSEKAFYILAPVLILQLCLGGGLVPVEGTRIEPASQAAVLAYWPYNAIAGKLAPFTTAGVDPAIKYDEEVRKAIDERLDGEKAEPDKPGGRRHAESKRQLIGKPWSTSIAAMAAQMALLALGTLVSLSRRPDMRDPR
jgi:ABC-type multidrug transport system ATPase subunit/pSer/pThr/pTyr-binding forkhead associated (FHA) protein/ABC-type multidrug transport system permease subunit